MCLHVETIKDHTSGDVICVKCGLVLEKIFLDSSIRDHEVKNVGLNPIKSKKSRTTNLRHETKDFLISMNIH